MLLTSDKPQCNIFKLEVTAANVNILKTDSLQNHKFNLILICEVMHFEINCTMNDRTLGNIEE